MVRRAAIPQRDDSGLWSVVGLVVGLGFQKGHVFCFCLVEELHK